MLRGILFTMFGLFLLACNSEKAADENIDTEKPEVESDKPKTVPVEVITLEPTTFVETSSFYGDVEGKESALLISYTGGLVHKVKVKNGDNVKKGQSLCNIESGKYSLLLESAMLNQKLANEEFERAKAHLEAGNFSQSQLDAARQKLLSAKNQVLEAQKNRNSSLCISPISGIATEVMIDAHQDLPPGSPTIHVSNLSSIKIEVGIPENEISGFVKGALAKIKHPSLPDSILEGKISTISGRIRPSDKNFIAEIILNNPGKELKAGQTVEVILSKTPLKNAIIIPSEVILNLESGNAVMTAVNGKAVKVPIEKGSANATQTVVLSGLNAGDKVISKGQMLVVDGSPITVEKM